MFSFFQHAAARGTSGTWHSLVDHVPVYFARLGVLLPILPGLTMYHLEQWAFVRVRFLMNPVFES